LNRRLLLLNLVPMLGKPAGKLDLARSADSRSSAKLARLFPYYLVDPGLEAAWDYFLLVLY